MAVHNRTYARTEALVAEAGSEGTFVPSESIEDFVASLERPRRVLIMVKAGPGTDAVIDELIPLLEEGDIVIDAGNAHFPDTIRREQRLAELGLHFVGTGVSGGEEGALNGPSIMPGGSPQSYASLGPLLESISAKVDDEPCCTYVGPDGAGHFVKMVHNGIEYGDMQLIAEAYDILRRVLGMNDVQLAETFAEWNEGLLDSYLIKITSEIFRVKDTETGKPLVDLILDKAGQKGTGKWTAQVALDLGVVIPTINAAIEARFMSALKDERVAASKVINAPQVAAWSGDGKFLVDAVRDALYAAKICSYAQGFSLIRAGSEEWQWDINLSEMARIWKGGCIIRAKFLDSIMAAYTRDAALKNLLLDAEFSAWMGAAQKNWRTCISVAQQHGVPCLALGASLAYFDSYRTANLPQNLTQAQRDFFGAHTYERIDKPEAGAVHTEWEAATEKR